MDLTQTQQVTAALERLVASNSATAASITRLIGHMEGVADEIATLKIKVTVLEGVAGLGDLV